MSSCFIQIHHRCSQYKAVACLLVSNENCEAKLDNPLQASNLLTETTNPQQNTKDKTQPHGVQKQSCKIKICEVHTQKKIAKHRNSLLVQASDVWLQLQKLIFGLLQQVQHYPLYLQFQHDQYTCLKFTNTYYLLLIIIICFSICRNSFQTIA